MGITNFSALNAKERLKGKNNHKLGTTLNKTCKHSYGNNPLFTSIFCIHFFQGDVDLGTRFFEVKVQFFEIFILFMREAVPINWLVIFPSGADLHGSPSLEVEGWSSRHSSARTIPEFHLLTEVAR